jgi:hypothetical protein
VKCVLAHIHSDSSHCVNAGRARHDGAPFPDKPPGHSECRRGRERGRSIPFTTGRLFRDDRRQWGIADMAGPAAGWTRSRMTHFGSRLGFAQCSQFVMCSLWDEATGPFPSRLAPLYFEVVPFGGILRRWKPKSYHRLCQKADGRIACASRAWK